MLLQLQCRGARQPRAEEAWSPTLTREPGYFRFSFSIWKDDDRFLLSNVSVASAGQMDEVFDRDLARAQTQRNHDSPNQRQLLS